MTPEVREILDEINTQVANLSARIDRHHKTQRDVITDMAADTANEGSATFLKTLNRSIVIMKTNRSVLYQLKQWIENKYDPDAPKSPWQTKESDDG